MTSAVDERGAEVSPKFRVLLTASLVSPLIMFDSNIAAVSLSFDWAVARSVLR